MRQAGDIIDFYEKSIRRMWRMKQGGALRTAKGRLGEEICERIVQGAIEVANLPSEKIQVSRGPRYLLADEKGSKTGYEIQQDRQIFFNGQPHISIECKAYAEVAMYKRVLTDAYLLQDVLAPLRIDFCLLQLESMLGGDYGRDIAPPKPSPSVGALNRYFERRLGKISFQVLTLLDGDRHVNREIHKREYFKPMRPERVEHALSWFAEVLRSRSSEG